jgi:hypothetical protein
MTLSFGRDRRDCVFRFRRCHPPWNRDGKLQFIVVLFLKLAENTADLQPAFSFWLNRAAGSRQVPRFSAVRRVARKYGEIGGYPDLAGSVPRILRDAAFGGSSG